MVYLSGFVVSTKGPSVVRSSDDNLTVVVPADVVASVVIPERALSVLELRLVSVVKSSFNSRWVVAAAGVVGVLSGCVASVPLEGKGVVVKT